MTLLNNILNTVSSKKSFYIPAGMTVTGTFIADSPGQIAGAVIGDVIVNGRLIILKHAVIRGNVRAQELEILGSVTGDILCSGKMILQNECFVKGNINTSEIHVEKAAVVEGVITKPVFGKTETGFDPVTSEEPFTEKIEDPEQAIPLVAPVIIIAEEEKIESWF
ncbi:MAG: polymer-forming cytoskeletal protein [Ferruginibacter sp.]